MSRDLSIKKYEWLLKNIKEIVANQTWGTVIIKFENGTPEHIKIEEIKKMPEKWES